MSAADMDRIVNLIHKLVDNGKNFLYTLGKIKRI